MGGVDRGNQLRQYYHVRFKSHKLYKYVFWFLFDVSITNSYDLFHNYRPQTTRLCDPFVYNLLRALSETITEENLEAALHRQQIEIQYPPLYKTQDQEQGVF